MAQTAMQPGRRDGWSDRCRLVAFSASTGKPAAKKSLRMKGKSGPHEIRCVKRNFLRETLENELPEGTIRFSSKIVSTGEDSNVKLLHLADGSTIGADRMRRRELGGGEVAWPAKANPLRALGHQGPRRVPDGDAEESVAKMRSYVLAKAARIPAPLRFRSPLALVRGSISRGNVCVAGDAFHPTTPELGQGGCAALEDGVVLARCLSETFLADGAENDPGYEAVTAALEKYAEERRWRGIRLITAAYVVGFIQQSTNPVIKFLREKFLSGLLAKTMIAMADYDCGKL
ncbi:hypothetical protein OsI_10068 [Oryza sativa Indica Group]|uniref:FAD-binding domain-containing protein n=1 Tax=Oryza sativa subsp. indica TaxID=39946 RepID=A2XCN2_ORYSI|nr:hypothetical protein OsI_10068 [Oryza sativa Indica Group]